MSEAAVLAPDLASVWGYSVPEYPASSASEAGVLRRSWEQLKLRASSVRELPPWVPPVATRLNELMALPAGWDSYGAQRISFDAVKNALMLLAAVMKNDSEPPWIVPLASGGIQLEWHLASGDIEITFEGQMSEVWLLDRQVSSHVKPWPLIASEVRRFIPSAST